MVQKEENRKTGLEKSQNFAGILTWTLGRLIAQRTFQIQTRTQSALTKTITEFIIKFFHVTFSEVLFMFLD